MSAAELTFFDGAYLAHVAAYEERARQARKAEEVREAMRQLLRLRKRSPMRSVAPQSDAAHLPLFVAGNEPVLL